MSARSIAVFLQGFVQSIELLALLRVRLARYWDLKRQIGPTFKSIACRNRIRVVRSEVVAFSNGGGPFQSVTTSDLDFHNLRFIIFS